MSIRAPNASHRTIINGRTGSGKTVFGAHLLSGQDFNRRPWIICDVKRDELILEICEDNQIKELSLDDKVPSKPGLYHLQYTPKEIDELDEFLWRVDLAARDHRKAHGTGLFLDEGYSVNQSNKGATATLLTQGRSLGCPIIANFQRPSWMNQHFIAQADFFVCFPLTKVEDRKKMSETISPAMGPNGRKITPFDDLPEYYSLWHDVGRGKTTVLGPAPPPSKILETFRFRLGSNSKRYYI